MTKTGMHTDGVKVRIVCCMRMLLVHLKNKSPISHISTQLLVDVSAKPICPACFLVVSQAKWLCGWLRVSTLIHSLTTYYQPFILGCPPTPFLWFVLMTNFLGARCCSAPATLTLLLLLLHLLMVAPWGKPHSAFSVSVREISCFSLEVVQP